MSKRTISHQQQHRIEKRQHHHIKKALEDHETNLKQGLVITRGKHHAMIEDPDGLLKRCTIRPNVSSIVAGDHVVYQEEHTNAGTILSCCERKSVLTRPNQHGKTQAIAANITQMMIVVAPIPVISWLLLDSYLVVAEHLKLNVIIDLNKSDMECQELQDKLLAIYIPLGYQVIHTGRNQPSSDATLFKVLNHQTSVFVGQSGVGKSSLIKKVLPETNPAINAISEKNEMGQHTTSNSYFYHLKCGGHLIDSPGVREFSLSNISKPQITQGFREINHYQQQCKFRNCNHQNNADCAVLLAVKKGLIHPQRFENYAKIKMTNAKNF